jgi:predicted membrane protein
MPDQSSLPRRIALSRGLSVLLAVATVVLLLVDPGRAGSHGAIMARSAGAAMIVGAIACLVHGLGLRGKRPPVRVLTHPSVAWTLAVTGLIASSLV